MSYEITPIKDTEGNDLYEVWRGIDDTYALMTASQVVVFFEGAPITLNQQAYRNKPFLKKELKGGMKFEAAK